MARLLAAGHPERARCSLKTVARHRAPTSYSVVNAAMATRNTFRRPLHNGSPAGGSCVSGCQGAHGLHLFFTYADSASSSTRTKGREVVLTTPELCKLLGLGSILTTRLLVFLSCITTALLILSLLLVAGRNTMKATQKLFPNTCQYMKTSVENVTPRKPKAKQTFSVICIHVDSNSNSLSYIMLWLKYADCQMASKLNKKTYPAAFLV